MRRIVFWALLAVSLSANVAVSAIAFGKARGQQGIPREPPIFSRVGLDAGQRARVVALRETLLAERRAEAARLAALRGSLARLLAADGVDEAAIAGTLAEIEAAQARFQRRVVTHVLAVRETLRPEQRPAFRALVAENMKTGVPLDPAAPWGPQHGGRP